MRAVSLFSGAGGFEIGFERAGIQTVLQAEQDPWCLSVLERHWPDTERVTDVRQVNAASLQGRARDMAGTGRSAVAERIRHETGGVSRATGAGADLVYGGFPCQDVSVAGKRAGLSGERSGLWSEFERVVRELRPRWVVVENVPGLLSSNSGRDFETILLGLDELGYGVAWRVLDARYFGVPQRRRRVFIVGCLGNPVRAAQVLAVSACCSGHPAPRREPQEDIAFSLAASAGSSSSRIGQGWNTNYVTAKALTTSNERLDFETETLLVADLRNGTTDQQQTMALQGGGMGDDRGRSVNSIPHVIANGLRASDRHHGHSSPRGDGADNLITFHSKDYGQDADYDISPTVRAADNDNGGTPPAIAFSNRGNETTGAETLRAGSHGAIPMVAGTVRSHQRPGSNDVGGLAGVRRLTPLECERLMGWPDDHTRWTADGKEIPDSHRYRMAGNGVVAPVAEWLGHRLMAVDALLTAHSGSVHTNKPERL